MKNKTTIIIIILLVGGLIAGAIYLKNKGGSKTSALTRAQMQEILLRGNKYAGEEIEGMTDDQLFAALQAGGYKLTV